uniref:Hexose transporter 1 n=1 Tax=Albugo laibachii Nc14 TaxID=890382 RepID=F0WZ67_9STRA|nr:glucose transporter putative [Albugo laibachii Nc14]|eukprot:CCA26783.1 glucose transporter putative [Albugo laibachii Nc14]
MDREPLEFMPKNRHCVMEGSEWISIPTAKVQPRKLLYLAAGIAFLQAFQFGWSTTQLNSTTYHDDKQCRADPIAPGTCVLFPGHSKLQWILMVNAWILGGMIGSVGSGYPADTYGRRKTLLWNAGIMMLGAALQAFAIDIWMFIIGRLIAGIASGAGTAVLGSYLSEIAPPHLRGTLASCIQCAIVSGILLVSVTMYFNDSQFGARLNAGFPLVLGSLQLIMGPMWMVQSPAWLLGKSKYYEAHQALAKLFGTEHVATAMSWVASRSDSSDDETERVDVSMGSHQVVSEFAQTLKSPSEQDTASNTFIVYRRQLCIALACSAAQQLSGINAVFYYSSTIFQRAGLRDARVGNVIINTVNLVPTFFTGYLLTKVKKRPLMLAGTWGMFLAAIGLTVVLYCNISVLVIIFAAVYVTAFACSLGPLVWGITAELFPTHLRASTQSACLVLNWFCNLAVGITYPYIASALGDFGFLPFVATLAIAGTFFGFCLPETSGKTIDEIQREFE